MYTDRLRSLLDRMHAFRHLETSDDARNIASLARQLGVPAGDAAWIYRRSREVGFGAAMTEYHLRTDAGPTGGCVRD